MANSALGSQSIALLQLPSGMLIDFAGTVEPVGWLMCDGRAVSRATFSSLFASIGTAYGVGDGSTTFNLPDFRGRFARYNDNMGTAQGAASRDTGRAHGSAQTDAQQNISGTLKFGGLYNYKYEVPVSSATGAFSATGAPYSTSESSYGALVSGLNSTAVLDASTQVRTATETRPINLACNKLIKI